MNKSKNVGFTGQGCCLCVLQSYFAAHAFKYLSQNFPENSYPGNLHEAAL